MAEVMPKTIGQSLYWSYANMVMAWASLRRDDSSYQQIDFIIRNKTYHGLLRGTTTIGSFLKDERRKLGLSEFCSYCGGQDDLSLDHMIPRIKGGPHAADNLVVACRSCNSSKHARDLLVWMAAKQEFPSLTVLSRYLKIVLAHCVQNRLMDVPLDAAISLDPPLPFPMALIPHRFPAPVDLVAWFLSDEEE